MYRLTVQYTWKFFLSFGFKCIFVKEFFTFSDPSPLNAAKFRQNFPDFGLSAFLIKNSTFLRPLTFAADPHPSDLPCRHMDCTANKWRHSDLYLDCYFLWSKYPIDLKIDWRAALSYTFFPKFCSELLKNAEYYFYLLVLSFYLLVSILVSAELISNPINN